MVDRMEIQWGAWFAALLFMNACYDGASGDGSDSATDGSTDGISETGGASGGSGGDFECDPNAWPDALSMRRLSRIQYQNTVEAFVRTSAGTGADAILGSLQTTMDRVPLDVRRAAHNAARGGFRRLDQDVHQEHIDGTYAVAQAVATALTQDHLEALAGACAVDGDASNDDTCIDDFIARVGERALRRPLEEVERTFYRDVYDAGGVTQGTEPEAFADVVVVLMTAPSFLYMVEHGDDESDRPGVYRLGPYELAQRLSYQFWQAPPDEALYEAARSGALLQDEGYEAQVDRLLADPRSSAAVRSFFGEWLWLEDLPPLDARLGTPVYDAVVGNLEIGPATSQHMIDEVLDMAAYYVEQDAPLDEFFLSDRSFATTPDLAAIYGVPVWDGGEPPEFPQPERIGLITRGAFVATGSPNTRPIMKGVRIREALLCDELNPPPDNAAGTPPELSPDNTTREVVEMLTEQPGTSCGACHVQQINPLGYATENFDSLGRYREAQVLVDAQGNVTGSRPVDTSSVPRVIASDDRESQDALDLSTMLLESQKVQACFARNYVQWTFGRAEGEGDACMLEEATTDLVEGGSVREVLRSLALREEFKTRKIEA